MATRKFGNNYFPKYFMAVRPTLMETKNLYENGPNPFFVLFFSILWEREWSRFV